MENTAIKEVVDNGKNGHLVPTLDDDAFSRAVVELLGNSDKRHRFGSHGFQKARRLFRWDFIAQQYEDVLTRAAEGCLN